MARVVATDGLRIRSLPSLGTASRRLEPLASAGLSLFVVDGPVSEDRYQWYQVQPFWPPGDLEGVGGPDTATFGWVAAASREGEPWIEGLRMECPDAPSASDLNAMGRHVALSCYGGRDLTIISSVACWSYDVSGSTIEGPSWLDDRGRACVLWPDGNGDVMALADFSRVVGLAGEAIHDIPERPGTYGVGDFRITGHFDDPGSRECRLDDPDPHHPTPAELILWCRVRFVVSEALPAP